MAKRPRSSLTPAQTAFVDAKMEGKTDRAAAICAGQPHAGALATSETVRLELQAARRWLTDITQIKRLDVIEGIIDSIEMGRHLGDPAAVRQGWVEVSKLLGFAQAEVKINNMTVNQMQIRSKFEGLSMDELLAISEGRTPQGITVDNPPQKPN